MQYLRVDKNKRFLILEDGTPFFWLGDTAWELFHKLSREEAEVYLKDRYEKKFNVVQVVALAELDGLEIENAYGRKPLLKNTEGVYDPTMPDLSGEYHYWDHVDHIIDIAESLNIYIALLPTWGDKFNLSWGKGPKVFNGENALHYGRWLGERYKDKRNIVWVMGGDRPLERPEHYEIVRAMAEGIKLGDEGNHIMTFHPAGDTSSSKYVHNESWIDFNMIQSGHHALDIDNYNKVKVDYDLSPTKPVLDAEPRYEDHPINFKPENGHFVEFDIRQAAYWAVFSGAFGHTYGHHSIWCMCKEPGEYFPLYWNRAINRPAGSQMRYVKTLIESRPFLERIPDQSLVVDEYEGADHLAATRGVSYAFIYSPTGKTIKVNMGKITGHKVVAHWYDPKTGEVSYIGEFENEGVKEFYTPTRGRGQDWVLMLDDASVEFVVPGNK
ncbi:MAG: glycoside hydrolase family 140 protein [Clostridia bacterium]|nr:glycoside hydrolase family 140 protein [Clostridia bacterium]